MIYLNKMNIREKISGSVLTAYKNKIQENARKLFGLNLNKIRKYC